MATSIRLIRRYVWLIETIRRSGKITLEELGNKWMQSSLQADLAEELPERTFHRHRSAISDIFGIEILCDRSAGNAYYIANEEVLDKPTFTSTLFNCLAIDNQLLDNNEIRDRIIFEDIPCGTEFLSPIIEAISKNLIIKIEYQGYNNPTPKQFILEPYGLKQAGRRWYLISRNPLFENLTVLALDRIQSIELTCETFDFDKNSDIASYFNEVIGVTVDGDYDCEKVVLRIFGRQCKYIDSLPLHTSQKRIATTKDHSDYEFYLRPEYEFQHAVLGLGSKVEVISPQWLRDLITQEAEAMLKLYEPN